MKTCINATFSLLQCSNLYTQNVLGESFSLPTFVSLSAILFDPTRLFELQAMLAVNATALQGNCRFICREIWRLKEIVEAQCHNRQRRWLARGSLVSVVVSCRRSQTSPSHSPRSMIERGSELMLQTERTVGRYLGS